MKQFLALFLVVAALSACKKHEVDIEAMDTNIYDHDHPWPTVLRIDTIYTVPGSGGWHTQRMKIHVDDEMRSLGSYVIGVTEQALAYTYYHYPNEVDANGVITHSNTGVMLGTEPCYLVQVHFNGIWLGNNQVSACAIVEL